MCTDRATAYIKIAEGYLFYPCVGQNIPEIFHSVDAEAVSDSKYFKFLGGRTGSMSRGGYLIGVVYSGGYRLVYHSVIVSDKAVGRRYPINLIGGDTGKGSHPGKACGITAVIIGKV